MVGVQEAVEFGRKEANELSANSPEVPDSSQVPVVENPGPLLSTIRSVSLTVVLLATKAMASALTERLDAEAGIETATDSPPRPSKGKVPSDTHCPDWER